MAERSEQIDYKTSQGVPFLIFAFIFAIIALVLWLNDFGWLIASAPLAFGLFLVACAVQSFVKPSTEGRAKRNPIALFTNDKWPLIVGIIPLIYAIGAALYIAPVGIRIFIVFFTLFAFLVFSYLRDFFRPRKEGEVDRIDKFYGKVGEAEEAMGVVRGVERDDIATRHVSLKKKAGLLGGMLSVAPWQLIAAIILAQVFSVFMCFYGD